LTVSDLEAADELERLKGFLGLDPGLRVAWTPNVNKGLSGEVKDYIIYIYEYDEGKAVETLRHEAIDYPISTKIIKPLINMINLLIKRKQRTRNIPRKRETHRETHQTHPTLII